MPVKAKAKHPSLLPNTHPRHQSLKYRVGLTEEELRYIHDSLARKVPKSDVELTLWLSVKLFLQKLEAGDVKSVYRPTKKGSK